MSTVAVSPPAAVTPRVKYSFTCLPYTSFLSKSFDPATPNICALARKPETTVLSSFSEILDNAIKLS